MSDADENMAILNIVKEGDPILRKTCRPVTEITPRIRQLAEDMEETLYEANGVGLAAPQVGILRRMVLVEVDDELYCLINPEIIAVKEPPINHRDTKVLVAASRMAKMTKAASQIHSIGGIASTSFCLLV